MYIYTYVCALYFTVIIGCACVIVNCKQSELSGLFNGPDFHYIYIFQALRCAVNVLKIYTCI